VTLCTSQNYPILGKQNIGIGSKHSECQTVHCGAILGVGHRRISATLLPASPRGSIEQRLSQRQRGYVTRMIDDSLLRWSTHDFVTKMLLIPGSVLVSQ